MKTVIISIRRENNLNIESGAKKLELRTMPPMCELPLRVLTYESGPGGRHAITNEWICDVRIQLSPVTAMLAAPDACVDMEYIRKYTELFKKPLYSLHISNLVVYKEPRSLGNYYRRCKKTRCDSCGFNDCRCVEKDGYSYDFETPGCLLHIMRAPQNYCYVAAELVGLKGGETRNEVY